MTSYHTEALKAANYERHQNWSKAMKHWLQAAKMPTPPNNQAWSLSRAQFCSRRNHTPQQNTPAMLNAIWQLQLPESHTLANRLVWLRASLGMTQAQSSFEASVRKQQFSRIEMGDIKKPKPQQLQRLAKCFGVNESWLSEGKGMPFGDEA